MNVVQVTGNNVLVFQDVRGNTIELGLDKILSRYTKDQDTRIEELKNALSNQEQIKKLQGNEILRITEELVKLREEKNELERKIKELITQLSKTDISVISELYQEALDKFLSGDIEAAVRLLENENLESEYDQVVLVEAKLELKRRKLGETFRLRSSLLSIRLKANEALQCIQRAVELCPDNSDFLSDLAFHQQNLGKFEEALQNTKKALKIDLADVKADYLKIGYRFTALASILGDLGNSLESKKYFELALDYSNQSNNREHKEIQFFCYLGLGSIYGELGDVKKGISFLHKAFDLCIQIDQNPSKIINNLAKAYYDDKQFSTALNLFEHLLKISLDSGLSELEIGGNLFFNIGCAKGALGDNEGEILSILKGIEIDTRCFGPDYFKLTVYYNSIGIIYLNRGNSNFKQYFSESLRIAELTYKGDHLHLSKAYIGYAMALQTNKNYDESILYFEKAISMQQRLNGKHDLLVGKWSAWLTTSYFVLKRYDNCIVTMRRAHMVFKNNPPQVDTGEIGMLSRFVERLSWVLEKSPSDILFMISN